MRSASRSRGNIDSLSNMRYLLLVVFVVLGFKPALYAQTRGKIAIVRSPYFPTAVDTVVKAEAIEPVEIDSIMPANLDVYDALFLTQPGPGFSLVSTNQVRLVNYIDKGGKLYAQSSAHVIDSVDSSNPLWIRFGIKGELYTDLAFSVTGIYGVPNQFTHNISDSLPGYVYQSGYGGPYGSIAPILVAEGFGNGQPLAYTSNDSSIKMILDEGGIGQENYPGYYSSFIADVVCDYFNLCAADVKPVSQIEPTNAISIVHDSRDRGFSVSGTFSTDGEVSAMNSLGMIVWHSSFRSEERLVALPDDLRNGIYFVTVRQGNALSTTRFAIVE